MADFEVENRKTKYFENLSLKIAHIEPKTYVSDKYKAYNLINPEKRLIGKAIFIM